MNTGSSLPRTTTKKPLPLGDIAIPIQVIDMHLTRIMNSITQPKTIQTKAKEQAIILSTDTVIPQIAKSYDVTSTPRRSPSPFDNQPSMLNTKQCLHSNAAKSSSTSNKHLRREQSTGVSKTADTASLPISATKPCEPRSIVQNSTISSLPQRQPNFPDNTEQKISMGQDKYKKAHGETHSSDGSREKTTIPTQPDFWLPIRVLRPNLPHLVQNSSGRWEPAVDAEADEEDTQLLTELVFILKNLQAPKEDLTLVRLDFLVQNNWIEDRDLTEEEQQQLNVEYKNKTITRSVANPYMNEKRSSYSSVKPVPPSILKKSKFFDVTKLYRTENSPRKVKYHFDQVVEKVRFFEAEPNSSAVFQQDIPMQIIEPICAEDKKNEEISLQKS